MTVRNQNISEVTQLVDGIPDHPAESLDKILGQAQKAYAAYMDATREVSRIYRENEMQVAEAYRRTKQRANAAFEEDIKQALKARAEKEHDARKAYQEAREQAEKNAAEAIAMAIKTRDEVITKSWDNQKVILEKVWKKYTDTQLLSAKQELDTNENIEPIIALSGATDPVLAQLWDNLDDNIYDSL